MALRSSSSGREYAEWLTDAGFREVMTVPCTSPGTTGVIVARA